jgi:hypothetical protein
LRSLGDNTVERPLRDLLEVLFRLENDRFGEITGQSQHLYVAMLPDDHRETTLLHQFPQLSVRMPHKRAGRILDRVSRCMPARPRRIGAAVSRDHHAVSRGAWIVIDRTLRYAERIEAFADDWIMDKLAENGQRLAGAEAFCERERVAHAKTNSVMFSEMNSHGIVDQVAL